MVLTLKFSDRSQLIKEHMDNMYTCMKEALEFAFEFQATYKKTIRECTIAPKRYIYSDAFWVPWAKCFAGLGQKLFGITFDGVSVVFPMDCWK